MLGVTKLIDTGRRRREPVNIQHILITKINKHKWKAAAPHGRLPHTKHKLKFQAWSSLVFHCCHSSFNHSEAPPWDSRPVSGAGVVHYQLLHRPRSVPTALGPAPLVTYPHRPSQAGGYSRDCALLPPSPGGSPSGRPRRTWGLRTDEAREKETEGWGVTETREGREEKKKSRSGSRTHCRSVLNQLSGSLAVPCDGTGHLWWTARCSSVAPPVEGSRQRVPRSLLLPKHGGWQQASASRRTGATPPLPLGRQPPLLDPGARQRVFRPTCSSIAPAPPLRAATGGLRYFLLPDLLSTAIPLSSEGSLTACPSFLPGFGHQCNEVDRYGKKEAGTGEHLTHLITK